MVGLPVGNMDKIIIHSKIRDFEVAFLKDFSFVADLVKIPHSVVVVGSVVYDIYKERIFNKFPKEKLIVLKLNEQKKTLKTVTEIYKKLFLFTAKRNLTLISFGGGINQDVTGFVASTIYRGINWIYIPTTLLAMADSAIGLKTSLNISSVKNAIGTFYPPSQIIINVDFLKTLKKKDFLAGVGEIVKFLLMKDNPLKHLEDSVKKIRLLNLNSNNSFVTKIIKESIEIKKSYMEGDEFDLGKRNLLNYGHELGHALEAASAFKIPHGVGVIIGMIFANIVALNRKWVGQRIFEEVNKKMLFPNIPSDAIKIDKEFFVYSKLLEKIKKDKKRTGDDLPLVLPKNNFELIKINNLNFKEFRSNLSQLLKILQPFFST